eukprot:SAG31_NODE_95_length_25901_cov_24.763700_24_plen_548_part_00
MVAEVGTCEPEGALDTICRLTCSEGFEESGVTEGRCMPLWYEHDEIAVAQYVGQNVTCTPERNQDGTLGEHYCQMERTEALLSCCASITSGPNHACDSDSLPQSCTLACAELWLPLSRDCEQYFAADQILTSMCEDMASQFLGVSPSTVEINGFDCHPDANGIFRIGSTTVRGKAHWVKAGPCTLGTSDTACFLYAVDEPHAGYAIGSTLDTYIAWLETYESTPPWGVHSWHEVCRADESVDQRRISLTPGYSNENCAEFLRLKSGDLTEACCTNGDSWDELLATGTAPIECGWDCAHVWYEYQNDCANFLDTFYPALATFTSTCTERHNRMVVYDTDGVLTEHGFDDHHFMAQQGLVYLVSEAPVDEGLERTEMELEAEGTHHPLAQQLDVTKQGDGTHSIEWDAPERISAMDIHVSALEGAGEYHLGLQIVGTIQRLSREAVIGRSVFVQVQCHLYDDCTYHYGGLEMRGDGSDFTLKFKPTTGFTYNFTGFIRRAAGDSGSSAVSMRLAIFPPASIASTNSNRPRGAGECAELPQQFREVQTQP